MRLDLLPEISLEETVHGLMEQEDTGPTADPAIPNKLEVMCEDDIVGHKASLVYHDSLKQLATHLILPVKTCTAKDPESQVECQASQPFEIKIKSRGTAAVMEWVGGIYFFVHETNDITEMCEWVMDPIDVAVWNNAL